MRILNKIKISILTLLITIGGALTIASTINRNHDGYVLTNSVNTSLIDNRSSFLEKANKVQPTQFESISEYDESTDEQEDNTYFFATIIVLLIVIVILVVTTIMLVIAKKKEKGK